MALRRRRRRTAPAEDSTGLDLVLDLDAPEVIDLTEERVIDLTVDHRVIDLTEAAPEPSPTRLTRWRSGFRTWRHGRPFWAGVWTLLGGAIIAYVPATAFRFVFATTSIAVGVTVGVIIAVLGLVLWLQPALRIPVGIVISLLSLLSFVTSDFGGFIVGMLCGLVGGSLATAWAPVEQPVAVGSTEPVKAQARHAAAWSHRVPLPHRRATAGRGEM